MVIECDESQHSTKEHARADRERAGALSRELGLLVVAYRPCDPHFDLHALIGCISHMLVMRSVAFNLPLRSITAARSLFEPDIACATHPSDSPRPSEK